MDEFQKQLQNASKRDISEFNTRSDLAEVRHLYKQNYETIKQLIEHFNSKQSIEDISEIDGNLAAKVFENRMLLRQINIAIATNHLTLDDII